VEDSWIWLALASALIGVYCSVLQRSLEEFSGAELEAMLQRRNRKANLEWLWTHEDSLVLAATIWRRLMAVLLVLSILSVVWSYQQVDGEVNAVSLGVAALIVFIWLWLIDVGLAWAISEHAATPVIAASLWILPGLNLISRPLVSPLHLIGEAVRRLLGAKERDDLEDELRQVVEESARDGQIGEVEREILEAVVDFRTATVDEIMTPRIDIEGIEMTDDLAEITRQIIEEGHSRFPVFVEDIDHIEGILYVKDLLPYVGQAITDFKLKPLLREAILVPESRRISGLLKDFQSKQVHMAIVLDEYGGTAGLVTIEDIVEEIVGEIHDEHETEDEVEPMLKRLDDGRTVEVDARFHIDDLNDGLGTELPEDDDYDTVGGWVSASLGRIPAVDEQFTVMGVSVTVLEGEKTHLIRLRLRLIDDDEDHADESASS